MNYKKIIFILCLSIFISSERNANAQSQTFNYTGSVQTWSVPCGVSVVTVDMAGAQGGSNGGRGGRVQCTYTATPAAVFNIYVGQAGATAVSAAQGGYNGGGNAGTSNGGSTGSGGGGGTDIRVGGIALANRVIIAGGGGGINTINNNPAGGGGLSGGSVVPNGNGCFALWATGGTQAVGGSDATSSGSCCTFAATPNGSLGLGANGGGPAVSCNGGDGGGGGGGGYYGGGAGGSYGSGAGGSSYTNASCGNVTHTQSFQSANGYVTLSWTVGLIPPVTDSGRVINHVLCGGNNGKAYAKATGIGLTYVWAPSAQTTDTATGLSAGTYVVTVNSVCGGSASASVTITQPVVAITAIPTVTSNVSCSGGSNGSISLSVTGGGTPYMYSWAPGGKTSNPVNGLSAGSYTVTVHDACGGSTTATATITQPIALIVSASLSGNVSCNGGNNGTASSNVKNGTLPYTYSWTPVSQNTPNATGLSAGTYNLHVTDNNGCTGSGTVVVTQPAVLLVSASPTGDVSCYGDATGHATSTTAGGTGPYTYSWTAGGGNASISSTLKAGIDTVKVTDANGCVATATAFINQPAAPITIIKNTSDDPGGCKGTAWVIVTGGDAPYTYAWANGGTNYFTAGLCDTTYCCAVTDNKGCTNSVCVTVNSDLGVNSITSGSGQINVYPNPNNGQFTVELSATGESSSVEIYNVLGEKVYTMNLKNGNTNVNIGNRPNGIYLYRVVSNESGNLIGEGKIVIQK